ncbi:GDSL-type esterase/lipase family protein [Dyadobacter sp. CY261]|uniref:GDSL-type esterase/lipase family protein n=1 Tax=Dyadobacter sp. CY261 TaxID=2907203 RepID=UPI001F1C66EA|nr:GDSL-type esterase/lipase family protein [Dyadobacter sp. CY261]MCF0074419.1 GDSL-type esterase/lipase family protein [Dyadobacter sp. CY261]
MRSFRLPVSPVCVFLLFLTLVCRPTFAQNKSPNSNAAFSLKDGDRVVFLGNSIFENEFQYGYLELALTTRFAEKGVTFRNLGWTGDNVWGEARSTYTNPPTPYEHLMEDITKAAPTIVFLAYGSVEAQEGQEGVAHFKEGLNKLIDKFESLGAKTLLLSTLPVVSSDTSQRIGSRNEDLQLYSKAISEVASQRSKQFIDIYNPVLDMSKKADIIENTVHLNETGYYYLADVLQKALGLPTDRETSTITISNPTPYSSNVRILPGSKGDIVRFVAADKHLPLPFPQASSWIGNNANVVRIIGLKKGYYTLTAANSQVVTASAKEWEKGVEIKQGPQFEQSARIREMIIRKNELHFFQYRPLNQTYIVGFRRYEQGRHVQGLEEQNILIKWLEGQIIINSEPKEVVYELRKLE